MKVSALKYTVLTWVSGFTMVIFLLMPFHAFLTVWASSLVGHYTALRLWKEALLGLAILGVLYLFLTDHKIRFHTLSRRLVWLILIYMFLNVVWGLLALDQHDVTAKALGYGLIVNLRFLAFFLVTWAVAVRLGRVRANWQWLILVPAGIVIVFGIIQEFALTPRFLEHFGYSKYTILPSQYVDNQPTLLRIQSTLRGANPLGAYLVVVISVLTELLISNRKPDARRKLAVFTAAGLVAMYFTYSRSAWLGLLLSVLVIIWLSSRAKIKHLGIILAAGVIVLGGIGLGLRNSTYVQNTVLHTSHHVKKHVTSNSARSAELRSGLSEVWHHPLGNGPGTAGPASVYNQPHPARIAENYFIQVGQETGWLGLGLFILINAGVGYLLLIRRDDPLALSLFAALIGLTFINLLSHAWADDTLAYVWWGLAGVAMAPLPKTLKHEKAR